MQNNLAIFSSNCQIAIFPKLTGLDYETWAADFSTSKNRSPPINFFLKSTINNLFKKFRLKILPFTDEYSLLALINSKWMAKIDHGES